jgi:hypothetical protein
VAEENVAPQSFFMWFVSALGANGVLIILAGFITFIFTLIVVIRGKQMAGLALVFIVPIPALIGIFGAMQRVVSAFSVLAMADVEIKLSEVAMVVSESMVRPMSGMLAMGPSYLLAMLWLFIRSVTTDSNRDQCNAVAN